MCWTPRVSALAGCDNFDHYDDHKRFDIGMETTRWHILMKLVVASNIEQI